MVSGEVQSWNQGSAAGQGLEAFLGRLAASLGLRAGSSLAPGLVAESGLAGDPGLRPAGSADPSLEVAQSGDKEVGSEGIVDIFSN